MTDMKLLKIPEGAGFGSPITVKVRGLVVGCRTYRDRRYTLVLSPSVDVYSNPQIFEIRSRGRLGNLDQEISCNCILSGSEMPLDELKFHRNSNDGDVRPLAVTLELCEMVDEF